MRPGDGREPVASLCIAHYQVEELMRLCLRSIRRYTDGPPYEVIVVDNGSRDGSLNWLRSLPWITLVERGDATPADWVLAMNTALDVGLSRARGRCYVIMHSDTIVKREGWLRRLVGLLEADQRTAAAGCGKLEKRTLPARLLRAATDTKRARLFLRRVLLRDAGARELPREPCPRDYCAAYRTAVLRAEGVSFVGRGGFTAGETVHLALKARGWGSALLAVEEMTRLMDHVAHATGALLPERRLRHARTLRRTRRRLDALFSRPDVRALLADETLDR